MKQRKKKPYFNQVDNEDDASTDVEECMLVVTKTCDNDCFYINNNNSNNKYKYQTTQHKLLITFYLD